VLVDFKKTAGVARKGEKRFGFMKKIVFLLAAFFLLTFSGGELFAQSQEITFILLRHAEKDDSPEADKYDPDLSAAGRERAEKLVGTIKKFKPNFIYSTNFKRTRATVTPLAVNLHPRYRYQIQIYDYVEQEDLIEQLLKTGVRTVVIVGHNSNISALANTLVKQDKYRDLDESEYNKIWIIKVKKNKVRDMMIEY
jgi:2,3-bisphosphoglycerate-dependent phosphoglycerate mutase